MAISALNATTYSALDGENIKISYSKEGLTLIKLTGGRLKETVDFGGFDMHTTEDGHSLFFSQLSEEQPIFLVFENGHTIGLELVKAEDKAQITHHVYLEDITKNPQKLAEKIIEGQRFSGFSEKVLAESYHTPNFIIANKLELKNGDIVAQISSVTNLKNISKDLKALKNSKSIIGFAASKSALRPGETCDVAFIRKI